MTVGRNGSSPINGTEILNHQARSGRPPILLLLHGFPTSSYISRDLIPILADRLHIAVPTLPGFGLSHPRRARLTFERNGRDIERFTEVVGFDRCAPLNHGSIDASSLDWRNGSPRSGLREGLNEQRKRDTADIESPHSKR